MLPKTRWLLLYLPAAIVEVIGLCRNSRAYGVMAVFGTFFLSSICELSASKNVMPVTTRLYVYCKLTRKRANKSRGLWHAGFSPGVRRHFTNRRTCVYEESAVWGYRSALGPLITMEKKNSECIICFAGLGQNCFIIFIRRTVHRYVWLKSFNNFQVEFKMFRDYWHEKYWHFLKS